MLITKIELRNIKSYADAVVELEPGVTAICGHNGAGKSTLLEAIGATLFGYLPYDSDEFVRAGERWGEVAVTIESAQDERLYRVVRRFGAGAAQYVFDPELGVRVVEGAEAVRRWLRQHLGLSQSADLKELFLDTLGVPQGLLTAAFLESASTRKRKFDRLLGVHEYQEVFDKLLTVRAELREQLAELEKEIGWLASAVEPRQRLEHEHQELLAELARLSIRQSELVGRERALEARIAEWERCKAALDAAEQAYGRQEEVTRAAAREAQEARARLAEAEAAAAIVRACEVDHAAYEQAQRRLLSLQRQRDERDRLRTEVHALHVQRGQQETARAACLAQLSEAEEAERRLPQLAELAERQARLEQAIEAAHQAAREAAHSQQRIQRLEERRSRLRGELRQIELRIAGLKGLEEVAARLPDLRARLQQIDATLPQLLEAASQLESAKRMVEQWRTLIEARAKELEQVRWEIAAREKLLPMAEQRAALEAEVGALQQEFGAAQREVASVRQVLPQVAGGLCPFLREPCKNVEQDGLSLEAYFQAQLLDAERRLHEASTALAAAQNRLKRAASAAERVASLPELRARERTLAQEHAAYQQELAAAEQEVTRHAAAQQRLEAITAERAELIARRDKAERAQAALSSLPGLEERARHLRDDLQELETELAAEYASLQEAQERAAPLARLQDELASLGDPRAELNVARDKAQRLPELKRRLAQYAAQLDALADRLQELERRLEPFAGLDDRIARTLAALEQHKQGYSDYERHKKTAEELPERREKAARAEAALAAAREALQACATALEAARCAYNAEEHEKATLELHHVKKEHGRVAAQVEEKHARRIAVQQDLDEIMQKQARLDALKAERDELLAVDALVQYMRELIRKAGPEVTHTLVRRISMRATRLFREIMGDHTAELVWEPDYEITLRQRGTTRRFAQLSGGEQMSAALAVRLALLQQLASIDVAFFDEPTQNMDAERRANLAAQIPLLVGQGSGFKQLVVISHDDTFESTTDYVIRVEKQDGRSIVSRA